MMRLAARRCEGRPAAANSIGLDWFLFDRHSTRRQMSIRSSMPLDDGTMFINVPSGAGPRADNLIDVRRVARRLIKHALAAVIHPVVL